MCRRAYKKVIVLRPSWPSKPLVKNVFRLSDFLAEPTYNRPMPSHEIIEVPPQFIVGSRAAMREDEVTAFFDRVYGETIGAIHGAGAEPVGEPMTVYYGTPGDTVDLLAGFPVSEDGARAVEGALAASGHKGVTVNRFETMRAATLEHHGTYAGLTDAWAKLASAVQQNGDRPGEMIWEVYLTEPGPEVDPESMVTKLYLEIDPWFEEPYEG